MGLSVGVVYTGYNIAHRLSLKRVPLALVSMPHLSSSLLVNTVSKARSVVLYAGALLLSAFNHSLSVLVAGLLCRGNSLLNGLLNL